MIIKGADDNLKRRINIIVGINLKGLLHYKIVESSVDSKDLENL